MLVLMMLEVTKKLGWWIDAYVSLLFQGYGGGQEPGWDGEWLVDGLAGWLQILRDGAVVVAVGMPNALFRGRGKFEAMYEIDSFGPKHWAAPQLHLHQRY